MINDIPAIEQLKHDFASSSSRYGYHERLGQYFINRYIKSPWPELFYSTDENKTLFLISKWLKDHQYTEQLPSKIRDMD
jgi:hypothetical protein